MRESPERWYVCACGQTTIALPFPPPLLADCCRQSYRDAGPVTRTAPRSVEGERRAGGLT